ncbi:tetratricopeptide repeat-containing sensor histidine kinase [Lutibacter sp.]|uniref:tetratricopeptide repeat-containing sensor histidine kinase n=1 Tax=Lutibacter sp. TaxID=1925666 RepID=UPI0025BFDCB7|nr:tetratricopeptide repeat-containing sensor histidine kinase [Lutibacter sp.]MCF6167294.1 tetratricopeptide repeat-containing sensor histidine kinase [Lutibacter sp.]
MREKFLILFCIGLSFFVSGQEISDLKEKLKLELADTTRVSLNFKIADLYLKNGSDSASSYYNRALDLALKIDSKPQIAEIHYAIGKYNHNTNDYNVAIKNYLVAAQIFKKIENTKKEARMYNNIASCYLRLYAEDKSIEYYLKSLSLNKKVNYQGGIAKNYIGVGDLFYTQGNYEHAKQYFQDALEIYKKIDDKSGISTSYTNLGNATADAGDNLAGLEFYKKSVEIGKEINNQQGIAINYNNIGDCYIQLKQYPKALDYFFKALKLSKNLGRNDLTSVLLMNISTVQIKTKNYHQGIVNANKSLKLAEQMGELNYQAENFELLSNAYERLGNMRRAFRYNKKYIIIKDSLLKIDKTNKVKLFQALNELDATQDTINELSIKNEIAELRYETGRKFVYFLTGSMVLFGLFLIILIQQQTAKKKAYNLLEYKNYQINKMNDEIQAQRDNLKLINKTKDKFFSIIAHDLKNPFNSIKGFTELMIENSNEYDEEKKLKFLKIIKGSTLKASSLLNNLLIWANSQSGNLKFDPQKVELKQIVSNVISLLEIQAINKEIEIIDNIEKNLFVLADRNMLATILRNLISNAIKFTNQHGKIEVSATKKEGFVEISVKDNGVGILESEVKNLFNIEVKNSNVGTANEQGSGLGLILCKDFVEKHGGKIWVESEVNKGTEFKFTIPLAN